MPRLTADTTHPILTIDGAVAHPSATSLDVSAYLKLAVTSSPGQRDPLLSVAITLALCPSTNPRYARRDTNGDGVPDTHCDAFAADYCRAHGVSLPQWQDADGTPTPRGKGREVNADGMRAWLEAHGAQYGWRRCSWSGEAQQLANLGHPVVAVCPGHIAVVRPGPFAPDAPWLAQAGAHNFNLGDFARGFGQHSAESWVNDAAAPLFLPAP